MRYALTIFLAISSICFSQGWTSPKMIKVEKECNVCAGPLIEWVDAPDEPFFYDNMMATWDPYYRYVPDSLSVYEISFTRAIEVCNSCYSKYAAELTGELEKIWDQQLIALIAEAADKRKNNNELRRLAKIKELDRQINELTKKRERLND